MALTNLSEVGRRLKNKFVRVHYKRIGVHVRKEYKSSCGGIGFGRMVNSRVSERTEVTGATRKTDDRRQGIFQSSSI